MFYLMDALGRKKSSEEILIVILTFCLLDKLSIILTLI